VKTFWRHRQASGENDVALNDGSGLSRNDLSSRRTQGAIVTVHVPPQVFAQFRDALPIAGVDGTLGTRMRVHRQKECARKTGSLSSVASLSGYVTTAAREHLVSH